VSMSPFWRRELAEPKLTRPASPRRGEKRLHQRPAPRPAPPPAYPNRSEEPPPGRPERLREAETRRLQDAMEAARDLELYFREWAAKQRAEREREGLDSGG